MTTTTAIGYHSNLPATDPESLVTEQVPVPELRPHDLLVEVEAVSVNPVDVKVRASAMPATPKARCTRLCKTDTLKIPSRAASEWWPAKVSWS